MTLKGTAALLATALVVAACSSGYTQEEVDQLVAEAVDEAIAEQNDRLSEEEAQQQIEEAVSQASLVAAVEACALARVSPYVVVDEGGLVMEGEGNESPGVPVDTILCVLDNLEIPDTVVSRISNTNSQMGLVEGFWGDYDASWSYHPDNGLFIHVVSN